METLKKYLPHLYILIGGSCWGLIGLFNRNLLSAGLSPQDIVLLRNGGGLLLLTLIVLLTDRSVFRVSWRHLPWFLCMGVISITVFTLLYFSCQQYCSLAVAAILLYTAPTFVVIMSAILWREPVTRKKLLALAVAFLGCATVSGVFSGGLSVTPRGFLLGLGSGFFYATYSIFGRYALANYKPLTVTYYTFAFAALASLFVTRPAAVLSTVAADGRLALLVLGLAAIATVIPYLFYTKGLAQVESGKASILASIEPVVAALVGVIAFGEPMTAGVALGLVCILASVYILR